MTEKATFSPKWDLRFLRLAREISLWSKDPSTKTGCVIVDKDRRIVSTGYNGLPQLVWDNPARYEDRDIKYDMILHCEENAILFCHANLQGCTVYTWPFQSCSRCAAKLSQVKIFRQVSVFPSEDISTRWADSINRAQLIFTESAIKLNLYERSELDKDLTTLP